MKIGSPNNIEILLHCHCSPGVHERIHAPAVGLAIDRFLDAGAIVHGEEPNTYKTTHLGCAWVEALCNVEAPRLAYIDREKNILKIVGNT